VIIAELKSTKYKSLEDIGELPIIGNFFVILFSILPSITLLFIDLPKEYETPYFYYISAAWCYILTRIDIKIKVFFIPAWILFFLLGVGIGASAYFKF